MASREIRPGFQLKQDKELGPILPGKMIKTTPPLTHQILSLFRKKSFDAVDTIADWKLSNAAVLRETTMTSTIPTVQAGSCSRR